MTQPPATVDGVPAAEDLLGRVRAHLADRGAPVTPSRVAAAVRAEGGVLGDAEVLAVVGRLHAEIAGVGPLAPLLEDPAVTDVLVNGPDRVWVDRGEGLELTPVRLAGEAAVRRLACRLAGSAGRRLDDASPCVDARLSGGVRLHAVLPPVSPTGTLISLRVPPRRALTIPGLVESGSLPPALAGSLRSLVEARRSFLVSGGTGSGKTTLLSCLLGLVPHDERVLLVEDSGELAPEHPHVVRLQARRRNVEGAGEVGLTELVRQALRMRPDRLVVGEVRGAEVVDLLAALNTGHEGGCGTVHANAAEDVPARLEALGVAAGLSREALHSQLAAAVDVVVHLARPRGGPRRVDAVCVFERASDGLVRAVPAIDAGGAPGPGAPRLEALLSRPSRHDHARPGPASGGAGGLFEPPARDDAGHS